MTRVLTMAAIYVETGFYNRLANELAAIEPCPFAGRVTPDQIKIALGEVLNLWPQSIADDDEED